jgi:predicted TIM-barrel enzyme
LKAEGVITGCAYEGIQYRAELNATHIKIFTDIYDRVGVPMHPLPLPEACRQAVTFCQSDGLVLTGMNVDDSVSMFDQIAPLKLGVPLILGGSATAQSVPRFADANRHADHFVVHGAFIKKGLPSENGLPVEWGSDEVRIFMQMVNRG